MRPIAPAITSGLTGIRSATQRLDRAAAEVATSGLPTAAAPETVPPPLTTGGPAVRGATPADDLVGNMIAVRLSAIEVAANVRSVDAALAAYRSVLEIGREQR
jgi:hypothetical protein